jgi:hypothetical protein
MASTDTILKLDTLVMIQTKFGSNWSSNFREEALKHAIYNQYQYDIEQCMYNHMICVVFCVPNVASFSGLSIFNCPFGIL